MSADLPTPFTVLQNNFGPLPLSELDPVVQDAVVQFEPLKVPVDLVLGAPALRRFLVRLPHPYPSLSRLTFRRGLCVIIDTAFKGIPK